MDIICDTNVWYNLSFSNGDKRALKLKAGGNHLVVSPVSFMELASVDTELSFEAKKKAAGAICKYADFVIKDPERHIADIWGFPVKPLSIDWMKCFELIANASSLSELQTGVPDNKNKVNVSLHTAFIKSWRASVYEPFKNEVVENINSVLPGYKAAIASGKSKSMKKAQSEAFHKNIQCKGQFQVLLLATAARGSIHSKQAVNLPNPIPQHIEDAFMPYLKAYTEFLWHAAKGRTPKPNDWGDLELFYYLQDHRRLLTYENFWNDVAKTTGISHFMA